MKIPKVTKTMMRATERDLSRHILLLNDRFYHVEEQYLQVAARKQRAREKALAKEMVIIKLHVKELKQIVLDFEELG